MSKEKKVGLYLWNEDHTPLSKEENIKLFREYRKYGDKKIRDQIVMGCLPLIWKYYNKYGYKYVGAQDKINPSTEDILSIGAEMLVKAVEKFDPDKYKFSFSNYLYKTISWHLHRQFVDCKHSVTPDVSLDAKLKGKHDEEGSEMHELVAENPFNVDILHDKLEVEYIKKNVLPYLTQKERRLFEKSVFEGKKHDQIAREFGVTRSAIQALCSEVVEKVKKIYAEGPTEVQKQSKGVVLSKFAQKRVKENIQLFKKYGRGFLKEYFLPTLKPVQRQVFNALVLNYRGQTLAEVSDEICRKGQHPISSILDDAMKNLEKNAAKLKRRYDAGQLPKEWQPTLLQQRKINNNERLIESYGGRFFLQRYFVPLLSDVEKKVSQYGFFEYEGESQALIAEKIGISQPHYNTCCKKILDKLQNADFEKLVDYVDNRRTFPFVFRDGIKVAEEKRVDMDALKKRNEIVEKFGGKAFLRKYFLPILPPEQRMVFDMLYISQVCTTQVSVAQSLGKRVPSVFKDEKVALAKLESTNFEELERIDKLTEEYLQQNHSEKVTEGTNKNRVEIVRNFGGIEFFKEKFLPFVQAKIDRDFLTEWLVNGKSYQDCGHLIVTKKRMTYASYTTERDTIGIVSYWKLRLKKYILPQLEQMKENMPDFDKEVREFYMQKGFETIHPEDFEQATFGEMKKQTLDAKKIEKKAFFDKELVERAGGEWVVLRDFRQTLKTVTEQLVFLRTIQNLSNAQISQELKIPANDIAGLKQVLKKKLESFADEREQRAKRNKDKNYGGKRVKGETKTAIKTSDDEKDKN